MTTETDITRQESVVVPIEGVDDMFITEDTMENTSGIKFILQKSEVIVSGREKRPDNKGIVNNVTL